MDPRKFLADFEQHSLPAFKNLHFQASNLQKAISSQSLYSSGQQEMEIAFNEWFRPLNENLEALLEGTLPDVLAGYPDAVLLVRQVAEDLPANQKQYWQLRRQFDDLLSSPL